MRSHVHGCALLLRLLLPGLALGGSTAGCGWLLGIEELTAQDGGLPPPIDADGGIDARQPDGESPRVLSATPEPDATGMTTGVEIAVTFSEAIDPASIVATSFQLVDDRHRSAVLGTASVEGEVVRFQPAAELTLGERYELVIGTAVTDLSGTPLAEEWRSAFTVREGVLGAAASLTTGTVAPRAMGMGGHGEAFALWSDEGSIYSRHYQAGWQGTELVSRGTPDNLTVAVGSEDAALAVWQVSTARESASYINDVVPWVESSLEGGGSLAQVGVDRRGFGLAAWLREEGTHTGVVASRFSGAQWSNPVRLDALDTNASALQLAVDDAGNGVALWVQSDQIWTARFREGAWEAAAVIEQPSGPAREARMVMDSDGRGMAFWVQQDGQQYRMRWSSYDPRTGWSQPAFADGGPAINPSNGTWHEPFAFNSHGDAVILRSDRTSCGPESCSVLFADVFSLEQGWHGTQAISEAYSQFLFSEYTAAIDRHGNVQATWIVVAGFTTLEFWLRRYVPEQGWQQAVPLSCADGSDFHDADLIVSPQGRMLMSWLENAGALGYALCSRVLD